MINRGMPVMESNTVEALLDFCNADFDLFGLYPAVCALKTLTCLECEAAVTESSS